MSLALVACVLLLAGAGAAPPTDLVLAAQAAAARRCAGVVLNGACYEGTDAAFSTFERLKGAYR